MTALRESSDGAVRAGLERALNEVREGPVAVAEMIRRPFAYETSFAIDSLDVRLSDGERLELLVKDVGPDGLSPAAAAAKPAIAREPRREIAVYRDLLAGAGLSTPRFHGAVLEPDDGRVWLFLERIEGEVLTDVGDGEAWRLVAAWAGRLGGKLTPLLDRVSAKMLLRRDRSWHAHWVAAAIGALSSDDPTGPGAELAARLRGGGEQLIDRLEALPRAFVHGELYPSNVLVERRRPTGVRIAVVDWELAGTGPYALDLAALVGGWGEENRVAMAAAFHQSLPAELAEGGLERLLAATDLCRLALALQWIGWAPDWEAPEAHRHDWRAEATELLDRIGVP